MFDISKLLSKNKNTDININRLLKYIFLDISPLTSLSINNNFKIDNKNIKNINIQYKKKIGFNLEKNISFPSFINYCLINKYKYFNVIKILNNLGIRFGIIQVNLNNIIYNKKILKYLSKNLYKILYLNKNSIYFIPKIGKIPYFFGQWIYNKYKIVDIIKSGIQENKSNIFLINNINNTKFILKIYLNNKNYIQEKDALLLTYNWEYSPKLIEYNDYRKLLIIEWCGNDSKNLSDNTKKNLKIKIQSITQELKKKYNLYHNDVRWKNICMDKNKKIKLIDWEKSTSINLEQNHEKIL